jgi:type III secretion protein Q
MTLPRTLERVRPFPWRSLETVTLSEVGAEREVKRWATAHLRIEALALASVGLLGTRLDVLLGTARRFVRGTARKLEGGVAVALAPAGASEGRHAVLVEAEGALASALVARALKRTPPGFTASSVVPSEGLAGAFAAVLLSVARRAHAGVALRVLDAGPTPALEAELAGVDSEWNELYLTVIVGDDAFAARVLVPRSASLAEPHSQWNIGKLAAMGAAPLSVPVVACAMLTTPEDIAAVRPGDAVVLQSCRLGRSSCGAYVGPVLLSAPQSDLGLRARLCEDGRLALGTGGLEPLVSTEARMDIDEKDALATTLGEVPIVMKVEIGEALMTAREWASLGRGDVISLGRRVGDPVMLRVGGVLVARGELVDLEGEVAVRILESLLGEGTKG